MKNLILKILFTSVILAFSACSTSTVSCDEDDVVDSSGSVAESSSTEVDLLSIYEVVEESGVYTTRDSVAAYLCKFDKLPENYVNKNEGKKLYESETGNSFSNWNFNPWTTLGVMIGGDNYDNNAGLLPEGSYHEADVEYSAKNRGTKRLVYQSNCVIYYTADHYETFTPLEIQH